PGFKAPPACPMGIAVRHGIKLLIGVVAAFEVNGDLLGETITDFLKIIAHKLMRVGGYRSDACQNAQKAANEDKIPLNATEKTHYGVLFAIRLKPITESPKLKT